MLKTNMQVQEKSEKYHFNEMAKVYDSNYTYNTPFTRYKIQKKITNLLGSEKRKQKMSILEIGAGTGEYTQYLAKLFPNAEIVAIDISPKILDVAAKKCKKYSNIKFKAASVYDLPFKKNSFDLVCGFYILHHLNVLDALREIHRVLKPDSNALFYEPNILNPIVFLIKSIPFFKKKAGDSPGEWAINPLQLSSNHHPFTSFNWKSTEFAIFPTFISLRLSVLLDEILDKIGSIGFLNFFGGSVALRLRKK